MSLHWDVVTMPGPWYGDEYRYGVTTVNGRVYRQHSSVGLQVLTEHGWRPVPTLTAENVKLTDEQAIEAYEATVTA